MRNDVLFFVHVLAGLVLAGGLVTSFVSRRAAADVARRVERVVVWPSAAILVGAGLGLAGGEDVWNQTWLGAGIVATVVLLVLGAWSLRTVAIARPLALASLALLAVAIWLMTVKPTT